MLIKVEYLEKSKNGFLNGKENLAILFISFCYFLITYYVAFVLYDGGVFFQLDLIFDSDPPTNLKSLAHGVHEGRNAYSHAFLELLAIPVYGIQYIFSIFNQDLNARYVRELLAIGYSPLFGSLAVLYFYKIVRELQLSSFKSIVFSLIYAFSFSTFVFSSLIETFVISGFFITIVLYLYVTSYFAVNVGYKKWFISGLMLSGVTITNIFTFFIVYYFYRLRRGLTWYVAFKDSALLSMLILLMVFLYYFLVQHFFAPETLLGHEGKVDWISRSLVTSFSHAISNAANVLSSVFNAFLGLPLNIGKIDDCAGEYCNYFSFIRSTKDIIFLSLIFSLFVYFLFMSYKYFYNLDQIWLFLPLVLILGYNFIFHTFFGREMFLYSQHWFIVSALLLLPPLKRNTFALVSILMLEIFLAGLYLSNLHKLYDLNWLSIT